MNATLEDEILERRLANTEKNRKWRAANPGKSAAARRRYRDRHRDRLLAERRVEYAANAAPHRERSRLARAAAPERVRENNLAWRAANPEKQRTFNRARRARKRNAPGSGVTTLQWIEILVLFDHACAYCDTSGVELAMEHVVPLVRRGRHAPENVVPACSPCNSSKKDLPLDVWLMRRVAS